MFPIKSQFHVRDTMFWVVGFTPEGELVCIRRDPAHVTRSEFNFLVQQADLLDPHALLDIATKH